MAGGRSALLLALSVSALLFTCCSAGFLQEFKVTYAGENHSNVLPNDAMNGVQLRMDPSGGATFESYQPYLYGSFSARIKLVPENSAGTVSAFFLSSQGADHDEIDFEFLGNVTGQPYKLHTNLFVNGVGAREQQLEFWFDPAKDFHDYSVVWNSKQITWSVDNTPVRVHKNVPGGAFPNLRGQQVYGTLYDGSSWATQGGSIPVNYTLGPFLVDFMNFDFAACKVMGTDVGACQTNLQNNWWEGPKYVTLSSSQRKQLRYIQAHDLTYNYCTDSKKYASPPKECLDNRV